MPKTNQSIKIGKTLGVVGGNSITPPLNLPDGTRYNTEDIAISTLRKMRDDYQISACLNVLTFTIQKMDWYLIGGDERTKSFCEKSIRKIWNQLVKIMGKSFWAGFSPATKVFEYDEINKGINYKQIRDLAPENCRLKVDENGNFNGFVQYPGQAYQQLVPSKYAFWYANQIEDGNLYGRTMLKAAYKPWYFSEIIHLFANRYYERFGEPAVITRGPATETVKDVNGTAVDAVASMKAAGEGIKNHTVIGVPSDRDESGNYLFDISYLESQMRGVDFDTYLKRLDMEKSRAIFVPDLLLGTGRVGSFELGKEHKATFITGLMGMMDDFSEYIDKYIIPQLVEYNFGTGTEKPEFAYLPLTKTSEDSLVAIIQNFVSGNPEILDVNKLASKLGVPLKDAKEVTEIIDKNMQIKQEREKITNDNLKNVQKINKDTRQKQFSRIENYIRNIYKANCSKEEKLADLSNTRIGFTEMYEDKNLYRELEEEVRKTITSGFKNDLPLNELVNSINLLLELDK